MKITIKHVQSEYMIRSFTTRDRFYTVKHLAQINAWTCTCPDNVFRGGKKQCKHIEAVQDHLQEQRREDSIIIAVFGS